MFVVNIVSVFFFVIGMSMVVMGIAMWFAHYAGIVSGTHQAHDRLVTFWNLIGFSVMIVALILHALAEALMFLSLRPS